MRHIARQVVADRFKAANDLLDVVANHSARGKMAHLIDVVTELKPRRDLLRPDGEPRPTERVALTPPAEDDTAHVTLSGTGDGGPHSFRKSAPSGEPSAPTPLLPATRGPEAMPPKEVLAPNKLNVHVPSLV